MKIRPLKTLKHKMIQIPKETNLFLQSQPKKFLNLRINAIDRIWKGKKIKFSKNNKNQRKVINSIALNSATIREVDLSTTSMAETQLSPAVSKSCIGVFNKVNSLQLYLFKASNHLHTVLLEFISSSVVIVRRHRKTTRHHRKDIWQYIVIEAYQ